MGLIKTSDSITNYCLPVILSTKKGYLKVNRYYDNESILFKAYYQLKKLNCAMKPLYPVVYDNEIRL